VIPPIFFAHYSKSSHTDGSRASGGVSQVSHYFHKEIQQNADEEKGVWIVSEKASPVKVTSIADNSESCSLTTANQKLNSER